MADLVTDNEKVAAFSLGVVTMPVILLSPGTIGSDDQQQLDWGFPTTAFGADIPGVIVEARSGVARANACRSNYYTTINPVITINNVDRTTSVQLNSLQLSLHSSVETPDTLQFTLKPSSGFVPVVNQTITLGLGSASNRIFGGQILRVRHHFDATATSLVGQLDVECVDWTRIADQKLICAEYAGVSATAIVRDLVATYAPRFTTNNVAPDLPTIESITFTNEYLTAALRRLAGLIGGVCQIDAGQDVHFGGRQLLLTSQFDGLFTLPADGLTQSGEPLPRVVTPPDVLTDQPGVTTSLLMSASYGPDGSQQRTRDVVEGLTDTCPIPVPAGSTTLPLTDGGAFAGSGTARIGTQRITYGSRSTAARAAGGPANFPGTTVTQAAVAGQSQLFLATAVIDYNYDANGHQIFGFGQAWLQVDDQCIYGTLDLVSNSLLAIPTSGYGSIVHDIPIGASVHIMAAIFGIPDSGNGSISVDLEASQSVVTTASVDDALAQISLSAAEGGDGIREYLISDSSVSVAALEDRASADLAVFHYPFVACDWVTRDLNTLAGKIQAVDMRGSDPVSGNLLITDVTISFPTATGLPMRSCQGSSTPLAELLNVVTIQN